MPIHGVISSLPLSECVDPGERERGFLSKKQRQCKRGRLGDNKGGEVLALLGKM